MQLNHNRFALKGLLWLINMIPRKIMRLVRPLIRRTYLRLVGRNQTVVLGRVACLGRDIFNISQTTKARTSFLVNQQKMRADIYLQILDGHIPRCQPRKIYGHMARLDVYPFIEQQYEHPWSFKRNIDYILIDSFSELTDQAFRHKKEGWIFLSHYTDIKHSQYFKRDFDCLGLLPLDNLQYVYERYFSYLTSHFKEKKIIFLNFPSSLDYRQEFHLRAREIARIVDSLSLRYNCLHSLHIPAAHLAPASDDAFPYHFSDETKIYFKDLVDQVLQANTM